MVTLQVMLFSKFEGETYSNSAKGWRCSHSAKIHWPANS